MKTFIQRAKPFIKWAGGKTQLLADIASNLPTDFSAREITYVEPFVGGGSVVFWMLQHFPCITKAVINDINDRLINVYRTVKYSPRELIQAVKRHLVIQHIRKGAF